MEEVGQQVELGELLHVREYIGKNHEYASADFDVHQVEYYFISKIVNETKDHIEPSNPDSHQVGIEWVPISDLPEYRVYPKTLRKYIINHLNGVKSPVYLGDMN